MISTDLISSIPAVKVSCEACTSCDIEVSQGSLILPKDVQKKLISDISFTGQISVLWIWQRPKNTEISHLSSP